MSWAEVFHDVLLVSVSVLGCLFSFHMGLTFRLDNIITIGQEKTYDFDEPIVPRRERGEVIIVDSDER